MINRIRENETAELKYYLALEDLNNEDFGLIIKERFDKVIEDLEAQLFQKYSNIKSAESYEAFKNTFLSLKSKIETIRAIQQDLFDKDVIQRQIQLNKKLIKQSSQN